MTHDPVRLLNGVLLVSSLSCKTNMVHIIVKDLTAIYFGGLFTSACVY